MHVVMAHRSAWKTTMTRPQHIFSKVIPCSSQQNVAGLVLLSRKQATGGLLPRPYASAAWNERLWALPRRSSSLGASRDIGDTTKNNIADCPDDGAADGDSNIHPSGNPPPSSSWSPRLILAALCICMASVQFGYHSGVMNIPLSAIASDLGLGMSAKSACVSSFVVGGAAGALGCAPVSDAFGRRAALVASSAPLLAGSLLCAASTTSHGLCLGRLLCGLGAGAASVLAPSLLAELSPTRNRGLVSLFTRLAYNVGVIASYVIAGVLQGSSEGWWRSVFGAAIAPCLLLVVGLLCGASPESPQWLARHGRGQQAKDVIQVLQGLSTKEADEWLRAELVLADKGSRSRNDAAWDELLLPEHRRTLTICSGLALLQALGGSNAVIYFAATMFESSNGAGSHFTATLMVGIFNLLGTVFALRLSDVLGRRPLLLGSFAGMAAGMAALAAAQLPMVAALQPCAAAAVATAAVPAYILAFGCGVGPLPPLLYSEVFGSRIRSKGTSFCGALNWAAVFVLSMTFLPLFTGIGASATFCMYSIVNVLGVAFVYSNVFETKGRSLQQIEREQVLAVKTG